MKKLLFILLTVLLLGCENAVQEIETVIEEEITIEEPEPETEEEPEIIIYENVFKISGYSGAETTPLELSEPIIDFDGTEYNIETMAPDVNGLPVKTSYTDTERIISIQIIVDNFSSFYFINNNMLDIKNIDPDNMSAEEFKEMLTFIYPPPEPEIPEYNETKYHLSGNSGAVSDYLIVSENSIMIGGIVNFYEEMNKVYIEDIRKIMINMKIDGSDSFLFINDNMQNFFNIDFADMSYNELIISADIINRYPEEGILELQEVYSS
jgi:hypothetical protein